MFLVFNCMGANKIEWQTIYLVKLYLYTRVLSGEEKSYALLFMNYFRPIIPLCRLGESW